MKNEKSHHIKSTGYKTPDNYFESFDEKILSKLNIENSLDAIKDTGFKVPKDYFKSLDTAILDKSLNEKESKVVQLFSKKNLIYISSIAAAILLLFGLSILESKPTFDNLEIETVEDYFINEPISSYEMASLLTDEQLEKELIIDYSFNQDSLEDYLLKNAEIEDLIIE